MSQNPSVICPLVRGNHVLTWNLQWGKDGETWGQDVVMPILKAHHIGFLQEVPNPTPDGENGDHVRADTLATQLHQSGFMTSRCERGAYSFLTYWKEGSLGSGFEHFDVPSTDNEGSQSFPIASVVLSDIYCLINVHLRADYKTSDKKDIREKDIEHLIKQVRTKLNKKDKPFIWMGGDFNVNALVEFKDSLMSLLTKGLDLTWCGNEGGTYRYQSELCREWNYKAKDFLLCSRMKATTLFNPPDHSQRKGKNKCLGHYHWPVSTGHFQALKIHMPADDPNPVYVSLAEVYSDASDYKSATIKNGPGQPYHIKANKKANEIEYNLVFKEQVKAFLRSSGEIFQKTDSKESSEQVGKWQHVPYDEVNNFAEGTEPTAPSPQITLVRSSRDESSDEILLRVAMELRAFLAKESKNKPAILAHLVAIAASMESLSGKLEAEVAKGAADLYNTALTYRRLIDTLIGFSDYSGSNTVSPEALVNIEPFEILAQRKSSVARRLSDQFDKGRRFFKGQRGKLLASLDSRRSSKNKERWCTSPLLPLELEGIVTELGALANAFVNDEGSETDTSL